MVLEHWQRVRELFDLLADSNTSDRSEALGSLEPALRAQVEWMLANHDSARSSQSLLDHPVPANPSLLAWLLEARTFCEDDLVLGRFEVKRFLGRGGMGEVYECFDRQSESPVAIKCIRFELKDDKNARKHFLSEVQKSRQVAHPNVCRVHEIFSLPDHDGRDIPFLSMELLKGRTLQEQIAAEGAMGLDEAIRLAAGVCSGLAEAHHCGVLHRDLKSGNIMLMGTGDSVRSKIMDFGLARDLPSTGDTLITGTTGEISGTLAYMSPELLQGRLASQASDIYALGVVLYHAVTGRYPFEADAEIVSATMRISHDPPSPKHWVPTLPKGWDAAILACLATNPAGRPRSATEVLAIIQNDPSARLRSQVRRRIHSPGRRWFLGGIALAAAVGVPPILRRSLFEPQYAKRPASVLVSVFDGRNVDPAITRSVRSLVRVALCSVPNLRPMKPSRLVDALNELQLGTVPLRGSTALLVARHVKADLVIHGVVEALATGYRASVQAIRVDQEKVLEEAKTQFASVAQLNDAVLALCGQLQQRLAGTALAGNTALLQMFHSMQSENLSALEELSLGLDHFLNGEADSALPHLQRATEIDPKFALAWIYESKVAGTQRKDEQAFHAIERAYALRDSLARRYSLEAEALYRFWTADLHGSLEVQKQLVSEFPGESHTQRQIAQSYAFLGLPEEGVPHARLAVQLDPAAGNNYMVLAGTAAQAGRLDEASAVIATARSTKATNPEALLLTEAGVAGISGDAARCYELLRQLETKPGWEMHARDQLTQYRIFCGDLTGARDQLESSAYLAASRLYWANEARFLYWLGLLSWLSGDSGGAGSNAAKLASRPAQPFQWFTFRAAAELAWLSEDARSLHEAAGKLRKIASNYPSRHLAALLAQAEAYELWGSGAHDAARRRLGQAHDLLGDVTMTWSFAEMCRRSGLFSQALPLYQSVVARRNTSLRFGCQVHWVTSLALAAQCDRALGRFADSQPLFDRFVQHWGGVKDVRVVDQLLNQTYPN